MHPFRRAVHMRTVWGAGPARLFLFPVWLMELWTARWGSHQVKASSNKDTIDTVTANLFSLFEVSKWLPLSVTQEVLASLVQRLIAPYPLHSGWEI